MSQTEIAVVMGVVLLIVLLQFSSQTPSKTNRYSHASPTASSFAVLAKTP
tara:strand:- start:4184 stop:4333 length:150 start_codon:yes stop_codon:yes gene_type:complete